MDKTKLKDVNEDFKEANQTIRKVIGEDTKIKYNIVDGIEPSPSGKYMYAFSRVKDWERTQIFKVKTRIYLSFLEE